MSRSAVRLAGELPTRKIVLGVKPLLGPMLFATSPEVRGRERLPDPKAGPLLFVGNHTVFGMLDIWALFLTLLEEDGILLRGLGDHLHFKIPVWGELLAAFGAVDGTRENCGALLAAGESVLVFPGGAREVAKRKGEAYRLIWKERIGFVQLAIEHGATIVPFSAVGVEDAFDLVVDADELMRSPLGPLLTRFGVRAEAIPPIAKGRGERLLPRPEKLYFMIGTPIPTSHLRGRQGDVAVCRELRDRVRAEVERGIVELQKVQAEDGDRRLRVRVERGASRTIAKVRAAVGRAAPKRAIEAVKKTVKSATRRVPSRG